MIPIYLDTLIIPPGTKLLEPRLPDEKTSDMITGEWIWNGVIENALAWLLPDREASAQPNPRANHSCIEADENADIDELAIKGGISTETIFLVYTANDIQDFHQGYRTNQTWAVEYMAEDSFVDLEKNLREIYMDALKLSRGEFKNKPDSSLTPSLLSLDIERFDPKRKNAYPISFLTLWEVESHRDFESGFSEIEAFHYKGPGQVVSITYTQPSKS